MSSAIDANDINWLVLVIYQLCYGYFSVMLLHAIHYQSIVTVNEITTGTSLGNLHYSHPTAKILQQIQKQKLTDCHAYQAARLPGGLNAEKPASHYPGVHR
jgi:hypothetical protein